MRSLMMRRDKRRWRKVSVKVVFDLQCSQLCHLSIQKAHKGCGVGRGEDLAKSKAAKRAATSLRTPLLRDSSSLVDNR